MTPELVAALRRTARRLETGAEYRWTHMGACNCGHLAQTVTGLAPDTIHRHALSRPGDWNDQLRERCPTTGAPMDAIVDALLELGIRLDQLRHLERLTDPEVRRRLPPDRRILDHRRREDVVLYLRTWADLEEASWWARESLRAPATAAAI